MKTYLFKRLASLSGMLCLILFMGIQFCMAQNEADTYKLRLSIPIVDFPQNSDLPYTYPSMQQSLVWGSNFYELSFWGIDALGNSIFHSNQPSYTPSKRILNNLFKYAVGASFSKYGSELPIPLGVWTHEEFHRAVLGVNGIDSENGNWLLSRWDGTVYGISDETLNTLKASELENLLYSYVAGVQSEALYTQQGVIQDFYNKRAFYKNSFYLYNAYYIWDYFRFSTSPMSDSVKIKAPEHESSNPVERDYAGSDLTAWVYDMFNQEEPFQEREPFPGGEGVNRRIGFSDLSAEAQAFLEKQRNLSMLNFINPAIFLINRIKVGNQFSFNFFVQYMPTHFGNDISFVLPLQLKQNNYLIALHNYSNRNHQFWGIDLGKYNYQVFENSKLQLSTVLHAWVQPENQNFDDNQGKLGGALEIKANLPFSDKFSAYVSLAGKTEGWTVGNPYLNRNFSGGLGVHYNLKQN